MKMVLFIILISCFSLTIISCADDKEEFTGNSGTTTTTDTTAPTVSSISPADNQSEISIGSTISVTFSESIDNSSVTANTSNTTCSGTIQVSSLNFQYCVQMSSTPSASNTNTTFSVTPSSNLSSETTYATRITTGVKEWQEMPWAIPIQLPMGLSLQT